MDPLSRRQFINRIKYFWTPLMVSGGGAYGYGAEVERHQVRTEFHQLPLALGEKGPDKVRIVSLSDFHYDPLCEIEFIADCVRKTNALKPDLVMLTGDFVTHSATRVGELTQVLATLTPAQAIFACLGNHDHWNNNPANVILSLRGAGIDLLKNQHSRIQVQGGEMVIAGLESAWSGNPVWEAATRGTHPEDKIVTLMHEPDFVETLKLDPRMIFQVSGHTHGGQVRLPGFGALKLPTYGKLFQAGMYDVGRTKLYVNRGLGTIGIHVRFLCPPEIACFDVTNTSRLAA
jgi:uncharacterized protein